MELKVGDIIRYNHYGLMLLTSVVEDNEKGIGFRLHGKCLFKMAKLISAGSHEYNLYEKNIAPGGIQFASDEDIERELVEAVCSCDLSSNLKFHILDETRGAALSFLDGDDWISMSEQELIALKERLNELNLVSSK